MNSTDSILSLNIRAGGGVRAPNLVRYLDQHNPSTIVLTEWRANEAGCCFAAWARSRGMQTAHQNDAGTANGILVASTHSFTAEPVTPTGCGSGSLMLARFAGFDLLACYYPQRHAKRAFFARCARLSLQGGPRPFLMLGDLNTGNQDLDRSEGAGRFFCASDFDELTTCYGLSDLWRQCNGPTAREWTWLSRTRNGFRIDHAFANEAFVATTGATCRYDHRPRTENWTDHSALILAGLGSALAQTRGRP